MSSEECIFIIIMKSLSILLSALSCMIDGLVQGENSVAKHYEGQEYKAILKSFFASL